MRFIAIPILILLLLSQCFSNWVVVLSWKINRDYIAKNLCINRNRPQLKCGGKCILMQRLEAKQKEEEKQATPQLNLPVIVFSSKTFFDNTIVPVTGLLVATQPDNRFAKPVDRSLPFFQPPRA